ncbi:MAG: hypothetical protein CK427_12415 [Leptospira sp.]|nr:MAG: hypothetical protein CK427_12415 [Leptospira sp.]
MDPRSVPIELTKSFELQLKQEMYTKIFSSDLVRCSELAHLVQGNFLPELNVLEDSRLREISFGIWEGKTYQEISEMDEWKEDYKKFIKEFPRHPAPQAESNEEFKLRISSFIEEIRANSNQNDKFLLVTHAGVIRQIASLVLGIDLSTTFLMQLNYLSMNQFQFEKDFTSMLSWNENWNLGVS